ncbi:hypothetical protein BGZ61DRAFT_166967 [Ilyonectria robusta]|uniref:uncharacterized protein n=1 Tax=Ilyonectria robusta TaxID=1079257 RepID=UPI001E8DF48A|nr:uncharacterized protein BGZ61DRAFT_166967 [Ilyonectria robusta]KAH8733861.1 hypothetical protein BGZ61DRAFT_166967 [Ilyonectria robusta]
MRDTRGSSWAGDLGRGGEPGETVDSVGGRARVDAGARQRLGRERKLELGARDRRRSARAEEGSREGNYRGVASHAGGCRSTEPARTRVSEYGRCVRCDSAVGCGAGSLRWRWHWRSKTGRACGVSLLMLAEMCLDEGGEGGREGEGDGRRDRITKRRGGLSSLDAGSRSWSWQWQWQLSLGAGGGMLCFAGGESSRTRRYSFLEAGGRRQWRSRLSGQANRVGPSAVRCSPGCQGGWCVLRGC